MEFLCMSKLGVTNRCGSRSMVGALDLIILHLQLELKVRSKNTAPKMFLCGSIMGVKDGLMTKMQMSGVVIAHFTLLMMNA